MSGWFCECEHPIEDHDRKTGECCVVRTGRPCFCDNPWTLRQDAPPSDSLRDTLAHALLGTPNVSVYGVGDDEENARTAADFMLAAYDWPWPVAGGPEERDALRRAAEQVLAQITHLFGCAAVDRQPDEGVTVDDSKCDCALGNLRAALTSPALGHLHDQNERLYRLHMQCLRAERSMREGAEEIRSELAAIFSDAGPAATTFSIAPEARGPVPGGSPTQERCQRDHTPNEVTRAAMEAAERGEVEPLDVSELRGSPTGERE